MEAMTRTDSATEPASACHPVKSFLESCGFDVKEFPLLRFIIESPEKFLKSARFCLPLKVPNDPGIYESFCRILRVIEIPSGDEKKHRRFLEVEWMIEPTPFLNNDLHPANSFLASEMSCPSCRVHFVASPLLVNETSAKIQCPHCLKNWTCHFQMEESLETSQLLLDVFHKTPIQLESLLNSWAETPVSPSDPYYYHFFPYAFSKIENLRDTESLFDGLRGWIALANQASGSLDQILRALVNQLSMTYLRDQLKPQVSTPVVPRASMIEENLSENKNSFSESHSNSNEVEVEKARLNLKVLRSLPSFEPELTKTKFVPVAKARASRWGVTLSVAAALTVAVGFILLSKTNPFGSTLPPSSEFAMEVPPLPPIPNRTEVPSPKVEMPDASPNISENKVQTLSLSNPHSDTNEKLMTAKIQSKNAVNLLRKSLAHEKENSPLPEKHEVESIYRRAMLHLKLQQGKEAAADFEQILKLDPNHMASYRGLGLAYYFDQQFSASIEAFEKYLKISKKGPDHESIQKMLKILKERSSTAALKR
jgi:tetratricopeptide (TPR) repeat protein